jgi:phage shock protein A
MKTLAQKQLALTIAIVFVLMLIAGCEEQNKNQPQTNVDVKQARLLVSENMQLQKQLTQSQDELKKSVAEAAKCSADIAKCSDELTAQKEMAAEYEKQLNDTPQAKMEKEPNETFDDILTMAITENTSLTQEIEKLKQENERLKEQVNKLTKELEEAKKRPAKPKPLQ